MPKPTIVTCFPIADTQVQQVKLAARDDFEVLVSAQDRIAEDIFQADIFFGHAKVPVDWNGVVEQGTLQWIQSSAAGLDHCLHPPVIESDIVVSGCSGLFAVQVAEQTVALLLGLIRRMHVFFRAQQIREYVRRPTDDLYGKSLGIVGFGGNGQRIARVLRPMVKRIIATDCFPEACSDLPARGFVDEVLPADQLDKLLGESDVVVVTLPLSSENEKRLGEEEFRKMKPGAYLINVGRGSVIDTDCLAKSLASGYLAGAGIDVVDPEPLPQESPLWTLDNIIISPHVGAQSALRVPRTVELFCENLDRYRDDKALLNLVDKELGFPRPEYRIKFE